MTNDTQFVATGYVMSFGVLGQNILTIHEPSILFLWLTGLGALYAARAVASASARTEEQSG